MPRTEIEFKVRIEDDKLRRNFHKKLVDLFSLKLVERRHLESDFVYSLPGDLKLRARYWQEFYANSSQLHIKKIITLKLPRGKNFRVVSNNEFEFDLSYGSIKNLFYDENYSFIRNLIDNQDDLKPLLLFKDWIESLYIVKDIFHFEKSFKKLFNSLKYSVHDKIRVIYSTKFEEEEIEICFDELPLNKFTKKNVNYIEFSCHSYRTSRKLQRFLKENMSNIIFDKRGYGKILREENIDFRFKLAN